MLGCYTSRTTARGEWELLRGVRCSLLISAHSHLFVAIACVPPPPCLVLAVSMRFTDTKTGLFCDAMAMDDGPTPAAGKGGGNLVWSLRHRLGAHPCQTATLVKEVSCTTFTCHHISAGDVLPTAKCTVLGAPVPCPKDRPAVLRNFVRSFATKSKDRV